MTGHCRTGGFTKEQANARPSAFLLSDNFPGMCHRKWIPSPQQHLCISKGSLLGPSLGITYCFLLITHSSQQELLLDGEMLTQHIGGRR